MPATSAGRRLRALFILIVATLAAGLVLSAGPAGAAVSHRSAKLPPVAVRENHAADVAIAHIGDPYHYGARGPGSFDCSGLTMYSYGHSRLHLPRTAAEQYASVRHIAKANLQRGDLVFFHDSHGHVYHVGIFLYRNHEHRAVIIHAPHTGQRVHRAPVWTTAWYAGTRRPLPR